MAEKKDNKATRLRDAVVENMQSSIKLLQSENRNFVNKINVNDGRIATYFNEIKNINDLCDESDNGKIKG